jgi:hypothetical protein
MDAMLGAIASDAAAERRQRFTLDAIMKMQTTLLFRVKFFTGF